MKCTKKNNFSITKVNTIKYNAVMCHIYTVVLTSAFTYK